MTDPLDEILGIGTGLTQEEMLDVTAARLLSVNEQIEKLKAEKEALEDRIHVLTPDEAGVAVVSGKQYEMMVTRSEIFTWDSEEIMKKIATVTLPDIVKVKYSLDKKKYLSLAPSEQKDWFDVLERKPGSPRIKVTKKF